MPDTPEAVFRRGLELLLAKDMDGFADLWAEDGTIEFPFAAAGLPERLDGREAVRGYMADYPEMVEIADYPYVTVHRTGDPEVIVAEFGARGRTVSTGEPYEMRYVAVVAVREGRIVSYRDYWSPVMGFAALGQTPALISALEDTTQDRESA